MSSIDERVVAMRFQNSDFEKGVAQTTASLSKLENALKLDGVANNVQTIADRFSAFGAIAFTALQSLTRAAIDFGTKIAGSILDPLIEGGKKRALNIEQAKFQFKGLGMDVEQSMADALYAVKDTAFGLDEAAVAASQFGASGIKSGDEMKNALRGISGVAAMAGSSYSDMANVFTKVAGQGRLMGDDLNRLGTRGINAAATLGEAFGKTEGEIREMVTKGQISFQDFSKAMSDAFGEHATKANETYTGSLANMRAALSRIGEAFFTPDYERQRKIFNALTPAIDAIGDALKPVVKLFTELGEKSGSAMVKFLEGLDFTDFTKGIEIAVEGVRNLLQFFGRIGQMASMAWKSIFPSPAESTIFTDIATAFKNFTESIQLGTKASLDLKNTFAGFFAVLDIGWEIIKGVFSVIGRLFGLLPEGDGGFLAITGSIGKFLVKVRDAIKSGDGLAKMFKFLGDVLSAPIRLIQKLVGVMADSGPTINSWESFWSAVGAALKKVWEFLKPVADWFVEIFGQIKEAVVGAFEGMDFNVLLGILNAGALGGLILFFKKIFDLLKNGLNIDFGGGLFASIKTAFGSLTDALAQMQARVKADILIKIAIAVGILAASLVALSLIEPVRLATALGGLAGAFALLIGSLQVINKTLMKVSSIKLTAIGISMGLIATAMLILSAAVKVLSSMDWVELSRGLVGLAVGLGLLVAAVKLLPTTAKTKLIGLGIGMIGISTAMLILANAVKVFSGISWEGLGKGAAALAGVLLMIAGFSAVMKKAKGLVGAAVGIVVISAAMLIMASAIDKLGSLSLETIATGLIAMGGSLLMIALALQAMPPTSILSAAALVIVGGAIHILYGALKKLGSMSWEEIGKSLTVLAGSLAILAAAMALMGIPLVLLGSVGLMAASVALMMLAPALTLLGGMSWDDIGRGLTMLGASLAILAVGGLLMIPASVGFFLLGAAVLMIGGGILMAANGLLLFSAAITALAAAATIGAVAIKNAILIMIGLIPEAMAAFAQGIIDFAVVIAEGGAEFTAAMTTLIMALVDAINETAPAVIDTIWMLIMLLVDKVVEGTPYLTNAGMEIMLGFLKGIENRIGEIIDAGTKIIIKFIEGIGNAASKITDAAAKTVLKFVNGLADSVDKYSGQFASAGRKLFRAVVNGVSNAIESGGHEIGWAGRRIGTALLNGAMAALGINSPSKRFYEVAGFAIQGLLNGTEKGYKKVERVGGRVGDKMLYGLQKSLSDISSAVATDLDMSPTIRPVLDLSSIKKNAGEINGLITPPTLTLDKSYANAASMVAEDRERREFETRPSESPSPGDNFTFIQNNTSPKALSYSEIYRQTRNQISSAKNSKKGAPVNA